MTIYTSEKVMPYVYMGVHKETGEFYFGSRWANTGPSTHDLGVSYFTSSTKIKPRFSEFDWQIVAEFFDKDAAFAHEQLLIQTHWGDTLLLNSMHTLHGKPGTAGMTGRRHSEETKMVMSWRAQGMHSEVEAYKTQKLNQHYIRRRAAMTENNPGFTVGNTPWNKGKHVWVGKEEILAEGVRKRAEKRKDLPYKHTTDSLKKIKENAAARPQVFMNSLPKQATKPEQRRGAFAPLGITLALTLLHTLNRTLLLLCYGDHTSSKLLPS